MDLSDLESGMTIRFFDKGAVDEHIKKIAMVGIDRAVILFEDGQWRYFSNIEMVHVCPQKPAPAHKISQKPD